MNRRSVKMGLCLLLVTLMFFSSISSASTSLEDPGMSSDEENQAEIEAELAAAESDSDSSLTSDSSNEDESSDEDSLTSDSSTDDEEEDKEDNSDLVESSQESGSSGITDDSGGDTQDNSDLVDPGEDTGSSGITDDSGGDTEDDLTQNDGATTSEDEEKPPDTSTDFGSGGLSASSSDPLDDDKNDIDDNQDTGQAEEESDDDIYDDYDVGGAARPLIFPDEFKAGDLIFMECKKASHKMVGKHNDHIAMYGGVVGGQHIFYEAVPDMGVWISNWSVMKSWAHEFLFAKVVTTNSIRQAALNYVKGRSNITNKPVDSDGNFIVDNYQNIYEKGNYANSDYTDSDDPLSNFFYCSELIWAAYHYVSGGDIDIDAGWLPGVWVNEIMYDDDVVVYPGTLYIDGPDNDTVFEGEEFKITLRVEDENGIVMNGGIRFEGESNGETYVQTKGVYLPACNVSFQAPLVNGTTNFTITAYRGIDNGKHYYEDYTKEITILDAEPNWFAAMASFFQSLTNSENGASSSDAAVDSQSDSGSSGSSGSNDQGSNNNDQGSGGSQDNNNGGGSQDNNDDSGGSQNNDNDQGSGGSNDNNNDDQNTNDDTPQPPTCSWVNPPSSGNKNTYYTFKASANDPDGDNSEIKYQFKAAGHTRTLWTSNNQKDYKWLTTGSKTVQVRVKDQDGFTSDWKTHNIEIN